MGKNNQKNKIYSGFLLALVVFLNGCAGLPSINDSIRVNLSSLKLIESTLFEQRFEASVRIQNRSQTEINVKGLSYDLFMNDKSFASGVSNQSINIAPLSEGVVTINLTSTLFSLIRQVKPMQELASKPFSYGLQGKVFTENDNFGISFSETGEIDLTTPAVKEK